MHKYGMLLKNYDKKKAEWPSVISPKLDGVRCLIIDGKPKTRNGKDILGIDHIMDEFNKLPSSTILDGELIVPSTRFDKVSGLVRDHKQHPELEFHVFDIPSLSVNQYSRLREVSNIIYTYKMTTIKYVSHYYTWTEDQANEYLARFLKEGYEGAVLKTMSNFYKHKRTWDWMRLVPTHTEDLVCIDVFAGKGKHTGRAGGIIVDYNGTLVKVGTGFTDAEREEIWAAPELFVGQIAEIKYKEITKAGSLRQPVFLGWRYDKC